MVRDPRSSGWAESLQSVLCPEAPPRMSARVRVSFLSVSAGRRERLGWKPKGAPEQRTLVGMPDRGRSVRAP